MARLFVTPIDLNLNEFRQGVIHLLGTDPASPTEGQIWYNTSGHRPKVRLNTSTLDLSDALTLQGANLASVRDFSLSTGTRDHNAISDFDTQVRTSRLDQMAVPTADVSFNSRKLTSLANGTAASDAINLGQLNAAIQGFAWKDSVRAATTAQGALATAYENGDVIDGVTLATGDRILLKNQTAGAENGIYTVNATGAPTRATDADSAGDLENATVFVEEGTTNAGTAWNLTTDNVTPDTTAQVWVQFGAGTAYTGTAPIVITGNAISLAIAPRLVVNGSNQLDFASGIATPGTYDSVTVDTYGRVTAGSNPAQVGKYSALIGDNSSTSIAITQATHGLATNGQMLVSVYDASTGTEIECDVTINNANGTVTLAFATAPATNAYRVVFVG